MFTFASTIPTRFAHHPHSSTVITMSSKIDMDPYLVLGIQAGSTDAEITKAYRKLALKLHPDKQRPNASQVEQETVAKRFQEIQQARTFLLENKGERQKLDNKRESERVRKQADAKREQTMSAKRKRMRDELKQKEAQAKQETREKTKRTKDQTNNKDYVDQLRRDGTKLREAYAEKEAERHDVLEEQLRLNKKKEKEALEHRQVRLKWDRKKISTSPSEDSIASSFQENFGKVEHVEFLGSKGNQALVTFAHAKSCKPCVGFYLNSKEMRAKFVGSRKEREEQEPYEMEGNEQTARSATSSSFRENETLEQRSLRQQGEREALLRQMEQEVQGGGGDDQNEAVKPKKRSVATKPLIVPLPSDDDKNLSPLEKLEKFERSILGGLLSKDKLREIQAST